MINYIKNNNRINFYKNKLEILRQIINLYQKNKSYCIRKILLAQNKNYKKVFRNKFKLILI